MVERFLVQNVSLLDRMVRLVVGSALLSLVVFGPRTLWGLIGLYPFLTAVVGTCPIYTLLGTSSCSADAKATIRSC